jgi:uncharacterized damage-inducible protein DinB
MNELEFFRKRHRVEFSTFQRVLDAMPPNQFDYRPHERSPSALELVWTLACEMSACTTMIERGEVHWCPPPAPTPAEAVKDFHTNYEVLDERVNRVSHEDWTRPSKLFINGNLYMEPALGEFLWYLFFDAIHHRGQLSTYIRPMGGKVPSIYGPSGDEPGR